MSLGDEIESLRQLLDELATSSDEELARYELRHPRMPPGLYWKARWLAGRTLRWLEAMGLRKGDPWPVGLKQVPASERARPLLVWAVGMERDALRETCRALADLLGAVPAFAVVLVTDAADFAFFSRLGWLVEYLPGLSGEGQPYAERKARFLARLYRGVPALPAAALLEPASREEVRRWLEGGIDAPEAESRRPS